MKPVRIRGYLMAVLFAFCPGWGQAQTTDNNILFILDASGSMAQKFGDQTKMQAAKQVFGNLLADLPGGVNVGLEVYGHQGDKDCSVIEVMNPVAPLDAASITAHVQGLTPRHGATPMAAALERGADALKAAQGEKAIVLISDGKETCGGDPAAAAKKLKAQGIDITTHVVGLGVNDEEKLQLAGIAEAGGGKYYAANNADELKESLTEIKEKVVKKAPRIIFDEEFDGEFLSDQWTVTNPDEESMLIEDGHLTVLLQAGWPSEGTTHNILLYSGDLPKDFEVIARFNAEVVDFPSFRSWETQRIGLTLYSSKENFIELTTTTGGVSTGHQLQVAFAKFKNGGWLPGFTPNIPNNTEQEFKIQKKGHKYAAFFKGAKGKWVEIGSITDLKSKYKPGIMAYRAPNARETTAEYDGFKIIGTD